MKRRATVTVIILALTMGVATQSQPNSPTQVQRITVFACPSHPQIAATWPAQCPYCGARLRAVLTQAGGAGGGAAGGAAGGGVGGGMGGSMGAGTGMGGSAAPGTAQPGTRHSGTVAVKD